MWSAENAGKPHKALQKRLDRGFCRVGHVRATQAELSQALQDVTPRVRGYGKVALARVQKLHKIRHRLLPQIQYWHRTGWVAAKKIISLGMPKLYSPRARAPILSASIT